MKKILSTIITLALTFSITSCREEELAVPTADFTVSTTEISINETVTFTYHGINANQVVVFPGDKGHEWAEKDNGNTGLVLSKGTATYAYKKAGVYTATIVASAYNEMAEKILFAVKEVTIIVKDDNNALESVVLQKDLYNKEMQAEITDDYVFICMPYKVNVKNKDIPVKIEAQRISVFSASSNAVVTVNRVAFDAQKKYDLTQNNTIEVTAASGDVRMYDVYAVRYPTFEKFVLAGVEGKVTYSPYNYDKSYINITLPKGTDLTQLVAEFVSADAKSVAVDGVLQESTKSLIDFSQPVTYTLTNNVPSHENITCESEVIVTVTVN